MFTALITSERSRRRVLLFVFASVIGSFSAASLASPPIPVRIGSISASDPRLANAVRETLLTDLAKSQLLTLLSGNPYRGGRADYTVTGSCHTVGGAVIINLRMVDVYGRSVPGAAENVEGRRSEVFRLVHLLADRFARRITFSSSLARVSRPYLSRRSPDYSVGKSKLAPRRPNPDLLEEEPLEDLGTVDRRREGPNQGKILARGDDGDPYREEVRGRYTSVIIDARGLGLERSMSPKIRRRDGSTIYDGADCTPDFAIEKGVVAYATSMDMARETSRAGSRPLVIDAIDRYDQPLATDPLITDDDAAYLARSARRDGFFKKFNVIFVIDR